MTDYSPSALSDLKKKIAHNAIAKSLYEQKWYGNAERGFRSSNFDETLPPVSGPTGTMRLTHRVNMGMGGVQEGGPPPGAKYLGQSYPKTGGIAYEWDSDPWTDIYHPWIQNIEDAFYGWDTLPEPADFDTPVEAMRAAVGSLTPYADAGSNGDLDGDKFTSVGLATDIGTLGKWIGPDTPDAWSGSIIYTFDTKYGAERINGVLNNQAQLAIMLGTTLLGEKKVWEQARIDIMALAAEAVKAFDPLGGSGSGFDLGVVKALADLVGEFIPAPYKPILAVGQKGLSLVEALMPPKNQSPVNTKISGGTADAVLTSLRDELRKLDGQITAREGELDTSVQKLLDKLTTMPASDFHIHPDAGVDPGMKSGQIKADTRIMGQIGYNVVPRIASTMARGAESAHGSDKPFIWQRTYVGMLPSGPYSTWSTLLGELDKVATGSASELVEAGQLLAKAAGGLREVDDETRGAMKGLDDEIARGKDGYHAYAPPPPPPPPVRGHGRYYE
jgi:hypothetical protein